ncbi:uncharacterized protein F4822DRAFT_236188 [Hypoxylon trugodes]|uniref:uncharacterized protein n=1 Tax=Hypoxylon trugodes TaxID=326681 RepID=UPI00218E1577|nr:uncharacterized protein F4822DRAFT_236188 [Hypoxylon trugodes]KAI1390441.1 hypothetical protein F4822DRAFT_236188 [Hypoxylon trugodes]
MKSIEDEGRAAVPINGGESLYGQPSSALRLTSNTDLGARAIASATSDGPVSSQEFHAIATEPNVHIPQDCSFTGQPDTYDNAGESLTIQDLENREAFHNLSIEGLADLAFIFSNDNTGSFQIEDGMV